TARVSVHHWPLSGPRLISETERTAGIDRKLSYQLHSSRYRLYTNGDGWNSWIGGSPPELGELVLARRAGDWEVLESFLPGLHPVELHPHPEEVSDP
ncbi:MAG: hypothetical protein AAGC68_00525, partial [Verrucomicrobiota bacterium]